MKKDMQTRIQFEEAASLYKWEELRGKQKQGAEEISGLLQGDVKFTGGQADVLIRNLTRQVRMGLLKAA